MAVTRAGVPPFVEISGSARVKEAKARTHEHGSSPSEIPPRVRLTRVKRARTLERNVVQL
jgi:hypothetical protein